MAENGNLLVTDMHRSVSEGTVGDDVSDCSKLKYAPRWCMETYTRSRRRSKAYPGTLVIDPFLQLTVFKGSLPPMTESKTFLHIL